MFPDQNARHKRLMAELAALEAQEGGLTAAKIVPAPKETPSFGKVAFFLGGVGALVYYLVFDRKNALAEVVSPNKRAPEEGSAESIARKIKLGAMDDESERATPTPKRVPLLVTPEEKSFLSTVLQRFGR